MDSLTIEKKLNNLINSSKPFALYYFKSHTNAKPSGLLLTQLDHQCYFKSIKLFNRHLDQFTKNVRNQFLACLLNYEAGHAMEKKLSTAIVSTKQYLGWLGWFDQADQIPAQVIKAWLKKQVRGNQDWPAYWLKKIQSKENFKHYSKTVSEIKKRIRKGETYQVNYTFPLTGDCFGNEIALFADLFHNQPVGYAALIRHAEGWILSLSPELFFSKQADHIITRPMKGTAGRSQDHDQDIRIKQELQHSQKNRAENVMIVDLLRNDLGRLCQPGSIGVNRLCQVESYKTVYQMTSTISGQLKPQTTWRDIFHALFPCGSVTGAPKIKTMEIINQLEAYPRSLYTGACGYIQPNGDGQFNVPIRTVEINPESHELHCGIGSGIVIDSEAESEWEETHLKSRFLTQASCDYQLIETMKWSVGSGNAYIKQHLKRMQTSARYFKIPFEISEAQKEITQALKGVKKKTDCRIRLLLYSDGKITIEIQPVLPLVKPVQPIIKLADHAVYSSNLFLYHKTTNRKLYNDYWERSKKFNITDYIFSNEKGYITEGAISNLFIVKNNKWLTPPVKDGLLPGIMRQQVIKQKQASEKSLTTQELKTADQIYITNSVKGLVKVNLK